MRGSREERPCNFKTSSSVLGFDSFKPYQVVASGILMGCELADYPFSCMVLEAPMNFIGG